MHWHYEHKSNVLSKLVQAGPDQTHSVGALSHAPKCGGFYSQSGCIHRLQVQSRVEVQETTDEYSFSHPISSPFTPPKGEKTLVQAKSLGRKVLYIVSNNLKDVFMMFIFSMSYY